jgi:hypothetical protein
MPELRGRKPLPEAIIEQVIPEELRIFKIPEDEDFLIHRTTFGKRCLRCKGVTTIPVCLNCGGREYNYGINDPFAEDNNMIACEQCDQGFSQWNCGNCGTVNPIAKTLVRIVYKADWLDYYRNRK